MNLEYSDDPRIERRREMVALYLAGFTLRDVGDEFGISGERVRQIIQAEGVTKAQTTALVRSRAIARALAKPARFCQECGDVMVTQGRYCSAKCRHAAIRCRLLRHLRTLAVELGRTPGSYDLAGPGREPHTLYYRFFGSLREAQALAGLAPTSRGRRPSPLPASLQEQQAPKNSGVLDEEKPEE